MHVHVHVHGPISEFASQTFASSNRQRDGYGLWAITHNPWTLITYHLSKRSYKTLLQDKKSPDSSESRHRLSICIYIVVTLAATREWKIGPLERVGSTAEYGIYQSKSRLYVIYIQWNCHLCLWSFIQTMHWRKYIIRTSHLIYCLLSERRY